MTLRFRAAAILAACLYTSGADAAFDPANAYREAPAVAARYPAIEVPEAIPSLAPGKTDFTSHAELMAYVRALAAQAPALRVDASARSQQGREIPVLLLSRDHAAIGSGAKPVAFAIGQQHGNEPAGAEALLVLARRLATGNLAPLLDRIDVVLVPRANPDGGEAFLRGLRNDIDVNRDHTLLRTPEGQALGALFVRYRPQLVLDCHEFTVAGRWVEKVGGLVRIDAMIQYATVPNLAPSLIAAQSERFLPVLRAAFDAKGLLHDWYYTTDGSRRDSPVAMGGIGPDTGRNVAGLRNAVSFLLETRGVGLGRAHLERRIATHLAAAEALLQEAARDPGALLAVSARAGEEMRRSTAPIVVAARPAAQARDMLFVDPTTGADRPVTVSWLSALDIEPLLARPRAAGYAIPAAQTAAIATLQRAGIELRTVETPTSRAGALYRVQAIAEGAKEDGRGSDTGAGAIVKGTYGLERTTVALAPGDVFAPSDQPLAGLLFALLEPENDAGLVANRLLPAVIGQTLPLFRLDAAP